VAKFAIHHQQEADAAKRDRIGWQVSGGNTVLIGHFQSGYVFLSHIVGKQENPEMLLVVFLIGQKTGDRQDTGIFV
jgi:hypothetical protein